MNRKSPHYLDFGNSFDNWYYNTWYAPLWPLWGVLLIVGVFLLVRWLV